MKAKKYANGGPVDTKKKKPEAAKKKVSSEYEARREESREKRQEDANIVRRQNEINKRVRMEQNPESYNKALAVPASYNRVEGGTRGISSAEIKSGAGGAVGAMTPDAAKRAEAAAKKPVVTVESAKVSVAPATKPGELKPETKAAIEKGAAKGAELGKRSIEYTMEESRKKGWQLKGGGALAKLLKRK